MVRVNSYTLIRFFPFIAAVIYGDWLLSNRKYGPPFFFGKVANNSFLYLQIFEKPANGVSEENNFAQGKLGVVDGFRRVLIHIKLSVIYIARTVSRPIQN